MTQSNLPPHIQAIIDRQAAAQPAAAPPAAQPASAPSVAQSVAAMASPVAVQPAATAAAASPPTGAPPAAFDPTIMPTITMPDQSKKSGLEFLPWNEPWVVDVTLHTVANKPPGSRCGPRFEAVFTVDVCHQNCVGSPIVVGSQRALPWFYTPEPIYDGKVRDATKASLGRFGQFVAGVLGLDPNADGFDPNPHVGQLVALAMQTPSLDIKLRLANQPDGVSKTTGKTFWKQTTQLI